MVSSFLLHTGVGVFLISLLLIFKYLCVVKVGYDAFFTSHSGVKLVGVDVPDLEDSLGPALIDALEDAYEKSEYRIRALVLCNPHSPLGRCYSKKMLEDCAKFCQSRSIHLISDEVFALSSFKSPDLPDAPEFASVLSLNPKSLGCDPERIHVMWSMSKDLAASGIRLVDLKDSKLDPYYNERFKGCIFILNKDLRDALEEIGRGISRCDYLLQELRHCIYSPQFCNFYVGLVGASCEVTDRGNGRVSSVYTGRRDGSSRMGISYK